jgi:hypothetical protein
MIAALQFDWPTLTPFDLLLGFEGCFSTSTVGLRNVTQSQTSHFDVIGRRYFIVRTRGTSRCRVKIVGGLLIAVQF